MGSERSSAKSSFCNYSCRNFLIMESAIQLQSHIGTDGVLHIEGLHQIADQDVTIVLTPSSSNAPSSQEFDLDQYAVAPAEGKEFVDRIMSISRRLQARPVLDNRLPEEILGYNETGLPE
jgi:hypothetical protein